MKKSLKTFENFENLSSPMINNNYNYRFKDIKWLTYLHENIKNIANDSLIMIFDISSRRKLSNIYKKKIQHI